MKNLHYHFKAHAKCKTRYQSGFQKIRVGVTVSKWDKPSGVWIVHANQAGWLTTSIGKRLN